jgi:hypothetical protein
MIPFDVYVKRWTVIGETKWYENKKPPPLFQKTESGVMTLVGFK